MSSKNDEVVLRKLLKKLKLEKYFDNFVDEEILSSDIDENLEEADVTEVIPKKIHRRRLMKYVSSLQSGENQEAQGRKKVMNMNMRIKLLQNVRKLHEIPLDITNQNLIGRILQEFFTSCELRLPSEERSLSKDIKQFSLMKYAEENEIAPNSTIRGVLKVEGAEEIFGTTGNQKSEEELKEELKKELEEQFSQERVKYEERVEVLEKEKHQLERKYQQTLAELNNMKEKERSKLRASEVTRKLEPQLNMNPSDIIIPKLSFVESMNSKAYCKEFSPEKVVCTEIGWGTFAANAVMTQGNKYYYQFNLNMSQILDSHESTVSFNKALDPVEGILSKSECKIIEHIRNNKDIKVLFADKGAGTVVSSSRWYKGKLKHHLNNDSVYEPVSKGTALDAIKNSYYKFNIELQTLRQNRDYFQKNVNLFDKKIWDKMLEHTAQVVADVTADMQSGDTKNTQFPKFEVIPKVHKLPDHPLKASREIVNQKFSYSKKFDKDILQILDFMFWNHKEFSQSVIHSTPQLQNFIDNVNDILLEKKPKHVRLITMDAVAMYTNLHLRHISDSIILLLRFFDEMNPTPSNEECKGNFVRQQYFSLCRRREMNCFLEAISTMLKNTYFYSPELDRYVKQRETLTMGAHNSPTLANCTLAKIEYLVFQNKDFLLVRYIDNIFVVLMGDSEEMLNSQKNFILQQYNTILPTIVEEEGDKLVVLDCKISLKKIGDIFVLRSDNYFKPTHAFSFAHFSGNLNKSHFAAALIGTATRIAVNCSTKDSFDKTLQMYLGRFRLRGYPWWFIRKTLKHFNYEDTRLEQLNKSISKRAEKTLDENQPKKLRIEIDYTPKPILRIVVPILRGYNYWFIKDFLQKSWEAACQPPLSEVLSQTPEIELVKKKDGCIGRYFSSEKQRAIVNIQL